MAGWQRTVIMDLSQITYLDPAGVKFMVDAKRTVESRGGRLYLRDPSATAISVLEVSHLVGRFDWVDGSGRVTRLCSDCGSSLGSKTQRCGACGRAT
jgi:hypothetical protein